MHRCEAHDLLDAVRRELAQVREELAAAKAQIGELERQLALNSMNSSKPPSSDRPEQPRRESQPSGRSRGAQKGHRGHGRKLLEPNEVHDVRPPKCDGCGCMLEGSDGSPHRHQVVELPVIRPHVVEYRLHELRCSCCGKRSRAELPTGVPRGNFGPNVMATVALLTAVYRLSKRQVETLLGELFGIDLCLGTVSNIEGNVSSALAGAHEQALEYVRNQPVVNVDETSWREEPQDGRLRLSWLWTATTPLVTAYRIDDERSRDAFFELLGEEFGGIVGSDRFSAYAHIAPERRQLCWAHLIRDFRSFSERDGPLAQIGERLLSLSRSIFSWWGLYRDGSISRADLSANVTPLRRHVRLRLTEATRGPDPQSAATAQKILDLEKALFTFIDTPDVEPTNNAAERSLRHAVIWRRLSFGSNSSRGRSFVERMLTTVMTLRQQSRSPLEFLRNVCLAALNNVPPPSLLPG